LSFDDFARRVADEAGKPRAFKAALGLVLLWLLIGPLLGFSDTWQLLINTPTTVITFLMVFVIQATTNRDTRQIKGGIKEVDRAVPGARDVIPEEGA
jgi:low affinity Fe/Cu permease